MEANLFLLLAAGVLVAAGVYLLLDRAMTKMLLGLLLLGNSCCSPAVRPVPRLSMAATRNLSAPRLRTRWHKQ